MTMTTPVNEAQIVGSTHFAEHIKKAKSTSNAEIEGILQTLDSHKNEWTQLEIKERLIQLDQVRKDLWEVREDWIQSELNAKGISENTFAIAEEWVILAQVFRCIRQIQATLLNLQDPDRSSIKDSVKTGSNGRTTLRAFPQTIWDRIIFQGVTGEIWLDPEVLPDQVPGLQASKYKDPKYLGGVALVLGAGNAGMLPICDSFHKMFVDLQVVALKMNPVNAHLGPLIEKALQSMIKRGFLAVIYGDDKMGDYLCNHPLIEELHMTGSDKTYQAIVFGTGIEGQRRKKEQKPINTKPFTGELGNVTPIIVVPGPWTESDINEYAKHIATWLVANAGFACCAPRVIIQHKSWPNSVYLLNAIKRELKAYPTRKAYYPGAFKIHDDYLTAHPEAIQLGETSGENLPWTIIPDVDTNNKDDICFKREAFGGLISEITLDAESVEDFLVKAVDFVNQNFWGSLCANLIVHPKSMNQPAVAEAVNRSVSRLRYGTVSINMLAFYSTYFMVCPWGAFPGHDIYDIQSGIGKNFNFLMLDRIEKVILKAPFRRIDPLTVHSKRAHIFAKKLTSFEASPSWFKLVGLMASALTS